MASRSEADLILKFVGEQVNVAKNIDLIVKKMEGLEKRLDKTSKEAQKAGKKISGGFKKAAAGITRSVGKIAAIIGVGGLTGIIYKAVKSASSFETKLTEVSTLLGGKAVQQMGKYEKAIRKMATETSSTANELTGALYQVISAGVDGTKTVEGSMELLETAQKMAVAGLTDVESSVRVVSASLKAYGKDTSEAAAFSDQMFTAVRLGILKMEDLAAGLGTVTSAAAGAGIEFSEVNAAMGAMTGAGVPAARAITSLNAIIRVASKGVKGLEEKGIDLSEVLGKKGLIGVMEALRKETGGSTIMMQKMGIEQEAITGLTVLAGTGINKFREALEAMKNSAGATDEAYKKMANTFSERTKKFWNVVNEVLLKIGNELLPMIIEKMEEVSEWMKENSEEISDWVKGAIDSVISFGKWIGKWGPKIAALITAIWAVGAMIAFIETIAKVRVALMGLKASLGIMMVMLAGFFAAVQKVDEIAEKLKDKETTRHEKRMKEIEAERKARFGSPGEQKQWLNLYAKALGAPEGVPETGAPVGAPVDIGGLGDTGKRTKDEIDAWKKILKAREAFEKRMHGVIMGLVDKRQKLEMQYNDELASVKAAAAKAGVDDTDAVGLIKMKWAKTIADFDKNHADKMAKLAAKRMEEMEKFAAKDIESFLGKIGGAELETAEERRRYDFMDRAAEKAAEPGFWDKVATGFAESIGSKLSNIAMDFGKALLLPFDQIASLIMGALGGLGVAGGDVTELKNKELERHRERMRGLDSERDRVIEIRKHRENMDKIEEGRTAGLQKITEQFVDFWEKIAQNLGPALEWIAKEGIPMIMDAFVDNLPTIIDAIAKNAPLIIAAVIERLPDVIDALAKGIPVIIEEFIKQIPMLAWTIAVAIAEAIWDAVKRAVSAVTGGLIGGESMPAKAKRIAAEMRARGRGEAFHEGGFVDGMARFGNAAETFRHAVKAHSGMFIGPQLGPSEVPAILEAGEGVIRKEIVAAMGGRDAMSAMNRGEVPGRGGDTHYHAHAEHMFARTASEVVDEMQAEHLRRGTGALYRQLMADKVYGFESRRS